MNAAIVGLMARGRITSTTILANGPAVEEALAYAKRFPACSFGVHLNVTEFRPLKWQPALAGWLDEGGAFRRELFRRARLGPAGVQAVYREWLAQVEWLRSRGLNPSHLDSHHDAHLRPVLLPALLMLMRRTGIRRVRVAQTISAIPGRRYGRNRLYNGVLRTLAGARTTAGAAELMDLLAAADHLSPIPASVEVAVHPGHGAYDAETARVATSWWTAMPFPVELISFHEL